MRLPAHEGQNPRFLQRPCVFARTLEGKQHLVRTRITTQTQEAVGQNATLQIGSVMFVAISHLHGNKVFPRSFWNWSAR